MLKFENTACIEASRETVWNALADLEKVSWWAEPVLEAHCDNANGGVGALRVCKLKGNMEIRERWTAWEPGESFTYIGEGMPLVQFAKNTWSIHEQNGMILVKSRAEFTFKGGLMGRLLEIPMGLMMKRMGPQALAGLKYWVENGCAYKGDMSKLPLAPVSC